MLGTAQLGMDYGIANQSGDPSLGRAHKILRRAVANGVSTFDTAPDYGESEAIIGRFLSGHPQSTSIITKLPSVQSQIEGKDDEQIERCVERNLRTSLRHLRREKVEYYLIHDEEDLKTLGDVLLRALFSRRAAGSIDRIGLSVYSPALAEAAVDRNGIAALQLPFNVFDRRFEKVARRAKEAEMTVFARSVFLQGLLFLSPDDAEAEVPGAGKPVQRLQHLARESRRSISELAFCFVRDYSNIDGLIVGVDNSEQLEQNVGLMSQPSLTKELQDELRSSFSDLPSALVNPVQW